MEEKTTRIRLVLLAGFMILVTAGCRSVNGRQETSKRTDEGIELCHEIKEEYKVYGVRTDEGPALSAILKNFGIKKEEVRKEDNDWIMDKEETTGEYFIAQAEKNVISYSFYRRYPRRASIGAMLNFVTYADDLKKFAPEDGSFPKEDSLAFAAIEDAVEETKSYLAETGFSDMELYYYEVIDQEVMGRAMEGETPEAGGEEGCYFFVFTPQLDGIPCFVTMGSNYYRGDLQYKRSPLCRMGCYYNVDGVYLTILDNGNFLAADELGTKKAISYEEAFEKAKSAMDTMEEASGIEGQDISYEWSRAGIEYVLYQPGEGEWEYQYIPAWVFQGKRKGDGKEAYLILDAGTGKVLSESENY